MRPVKDQSSLRIRTFLKLLSEKKKIIGGLGAESRKFLANLHIFTLHFPNSLALDLIKKFSCLNNKYIEKTGWMRRLICAITVQT